VIPGWILIGLIAVLGGIVGLFLGENRRGLPLVGLLLGALLGPVGWLLVLVLPDHRRPCPVCGEKLLSDEPVCPECGHELPPP
jgi:hypothetical protein